MVRTSNRNAGRYIAAREPFEGSNFRGVSSFEGYGRMNRSLGHALAVENADYVVYSYATPIAWHVSGSWVVPLEKFSVTTTRHQFYVREATNTLHERKAS